MFLATVRPHKAVSTQTISRWLVKVLDKAGIDVSIYSGHSTRAASTTKAKIYIYLLSIQVLENNEIADTDYLDIIFGKFCMLIMFYYDYLLYFGTNFFPDHFVNTSRQMLL